LVPLHELSLCQVVVPRECGATDNALEADPEARIILTSFHNLAGPSAAEVVDSFGVVVSQVLAKDGEPNCGFRRLPVVVAVLVIASIQKCVTRNCLVQGIPEMLQTFLQVERTL
jgi:hypothetical protein